ncbi:hypothetical protein IE53DRAFT_260748 [Violaceomyces palustris]|uniref:Uncharacterized protein n=1 Tax=Violaceomyces palustris TaxID=1673888 RepID=A0ACD0P3Q1_9BASI|nr:hypothetical protein IE53DRAFT_260748 [Violaceomyces palustris]
MEAKAQWWNARDGEGERGRGGEEEEEASKRRTAKERHRSPGTHLAFGRRTKGFSLARLPPILPPTHPRNRRGYQRWMMDVIHPHSLAFTTFPSTSEPDSLDRFAQRDLEEVVALFHTIRLDLNTHTDTHTNTETLTLTLLTPDLDLVFSSFFLFSLYIFFYSYTYFGILRISSLPSSLSILSPSYPPAQLKRQPSLNRCRAALGTRPIPFNS